MHFALEAVIKGRVMANLIQRITSNAVLFALLMSVSLSIFAHDFDNTESATPSTTHFIVCDIIDQANLDVDIDTHANEFNLGAPQPPPESALSHYVKPQLAALFSRACVRGPPVYFI
jgi:hypothetical protein